MTLEQLPPKGVKREQAILELGKDEANGELLFQLVNTEKGKCKTAAQKALAQLEYGENCRNHRLMQRQIQTRAGNCRKKDWLY